MITSTMERDAIVAVWSRVEVYIDLPDTVSASATCRALHDVIVDADTGRIKVSHFRDYAEGGGPWTKIPNYLPSSLNAMHFPSLRRLSLDFRRMVMIGPEETVDFATNALLCFPVIASLLSFATNLERLHIDVTRVLKRGLLVTFGNGVMDLVPMFEVFGRNLTKCEGLKELIIYSKGDCCPRVVQEFMAALTPTLTKQRYVMDRLLFSLSHDRESPDFEPDEQYQEIYKIYVEFFRRILLCPNLSSLDIHIPGSHSLTSALYEAAESIGDSDESANKKQKMSAEPGHRLQRLFLRLWGVDEYYMDAVIGEENLQRSRSLLAHFKGCTELQDVKLGFHCEIWETHCDAIRDLLTGNSNLSALYFICAEAETGEEIMALVQKLAFGKAMDECKLAALIVSYVHFCEVVALRNFVEGMQQAGARIEDYNWCKSEDLDEPVRLNKNHNDVKYLGFVHPKNFEGRKRDLDFWHHHDRKLHE